MNAPARKRTVAEFLPWAMAQERGRFELVDGEIVAMAPERVGHNLVKASTFRALDDAVRRAGLPCTVFTDGMTVVIDKHTSREPDAAVQCGVDLDFDTLILDKPLIVVEVMSPSSERDDTGKKLVEYFSVPSIRHYLVIDPKRAAIVHHARDETGAIRTVIARDGEIDLTPPGFAVAVQDLLGRFAAPREGESHV